MQCFELAWGKRRLSFRLPEDIDVFTVRASRTEPLKNFQEEVKRVLRHPTASPF